MLLFRSLIRHIYPSQESDKITYHIASPYMSGFLHVLEFEQKYLSVTKFAGAFYAKHRISIGKCSQQLKMFCIKEGNAVAFFTIHRDTIRH